MSPFEKKKSDPLKTLSEREIQSKLYGVYRKPHLEEASEPSNFKKALEQVSEKETVPEPDLFNRSNPSSKTATAPAKSDPSLAGNPDARPEARKETQRIERFIHQENKIVQRAPRLKPAENPVFKQAYILKQILLPKLKGLGRVVSQFLLRVVTLILSSLISLANLRDARSRRILSWMMAGGLLFLIVTGIQWLNTQREKAMKSPRKTVTAQVPAVLEENSDAEVQDAAVDPELEAAGSTLSSLSPRVASDNGPSTEPKPYVIQVATYISLADAKKMSANLETEGFPSFVEGLSRQSGRLYHCVFLGRYKTYSQAESQLNEFKKKAVAKPFQDAFIRALSEN